MNDKNVVIVILLVIGIIVAANGMMFLAVRGWTRGDKTTRNFINSTQDALKQPFHKEDKSLDELRKRVDELKKKE